MKSPLVLGGVLALLLVSPAGGQDSDPPLVPLPFLDPPVAEPTATPAPEPAATPPPNQSPARFALGQVRQVGEKLQFTLSARGGSLDDVRVALRREERTVRSAAIASLSGTRKLALAPKAGLKRGAYTVRVTVEGIIVADREVLVD